MREVTCARWRAGRSASPSPAPPRPANHAGGDHARRLRRPRRGAPHPPADLIGGSAAGVSAVISPSPSCAATSAASAHGRNSSARGRRSTSSSTRRSSCAAPRSRRRRPRRRALPAAGGPPRGRRPISDEELRDELVTVLGAGHETTATGLAWAMERLLPQPARAGAARESIAARRGRLPGPRQTLQAGDRRISARRKCRRRLRGSAATQLPAGTSNLSPPPGPIVAMKPQDPEAERFKPERFLDGRATTTPGFPRRRRPPLAVRRAHSPNSVCRITRISNSAKEAPMQRRTPPPKGIQA